MQTLNSRRAALCLVCLAGKATLASASIVHQVLPTGTSQFAVPALGGAAFSSGLAFNFAPVTISAAGASYAGVLPSSGEEGEPTAVPGLTPGTLITNATPASFNPTFGAWVFEGAPVLIASDMIAFRASVADQAYFGWIRLQHVTRGPFRGIDFVEYAYESTPNTPIAAGAVPGPGAGAVMIAGFALAARRRRV